MSSDQRNRRKHNNTGNQPSQHNKNNNKRRGVPPRRNQKPTPKKLTLWQKILKAIGLYKEPKPQQAPSHHKAQKQTQNTKPARKEPRKKSSRPAPPQKVDSSRLYVGNLSYEVTESDLIDLFKGFGNVKKAEIVYNKRTQRSKGFAFVEMMNTDDAKRASEILHEQPFMGRNMIVNGARSEEEQSKAISNTAS